MITANLIDSGNSAVVDLVQDQRVKRIKEIFLVLFSFGVLFYINLFEGFSLTQSFIVGYQIFIFLRFINNIGHTICFYDFLCFYSALDTLLMPMVGYNKFNIDNPLARVWGWYMRVPENVYFSFLIPCNLALFFGTNFFISKFKPQYYSDLLKKLKEDAKGKGKVGIVLTVVGFLSSFLTGNTSSLAFVFYLFSMLQYVGPFYIYYSDLRFRKKAFYISILVFLAQAILQGMFGVFVMYLVLALIIVAIQYDLRFYAKLSVFVAGLFFMLVTQSVKGTYRAITWLGIERDGLSSRTASNFEIFGTLVYNRLTNLENILDERTLFGFYTRTNQGYLISRAMDYVPRVEPYANGETILKSIAAVFVPRFLWPDKPEAGGHQNLARFLGIKKRLNYSMNIGPYGEAYGNFGPEYGIVFILVYGLLLSLLFKALINISNTTPTVLLWFPLIFFATLTVETDILSTINSFFKSVIFVLILYWGAKKFFKTSL